MGNYENVIYLAIVLAVVMGAIVLMHIITSTKKFSENPRRIPALCCTVFVIAAAALAGIGFGVNRAGVVSGFEPFGTDGVSGAVTLLEAPAGADADVSAFSLAFYDGRFLNLNYSTVSDGGALPFQVTGSGQLRRGEAEALPEDVAVVPLPLLADALRSLEALGWAGELDLPDEGAVLLSSRGTASPALTPPGEVLVLYGGELHGLDELAPEWLTREMPVLYYSAGEHSGSILLGDTLKGAYKIWLRVLPVA